MIIILQRITVNTNLHTLQATPTAQNSLSKAPHFWAVPGMILKGALAAAAPLDDDIPSFFATKAIIDHLGKSDHPAIQMDPTVTLESDHPLVQDSVLNGVSGIPPGVLNIILLKDSFVRVIQYKEPGKPETLFAVVYLLDPTLDRMLIDQPELWNIKPLNAV